VAESLGTAVLQVRLDDQGLVSGLNNAKRAATTALNETEAGANRTAGAFSNLAGRLSGILAGGFIAGGVGVLIGQLSSMASETDNANKATAAYGRALERFNQDVDAGNAQVTRLAERFGVLDTTVQQASTTLLRNGASLQDVERALTAAGASAAAQGTSIESAFQNVAIALATGRSELLESSGIITNLGPVYQAYAKSVNKSVEELTQAEKIQAGVNAIYKESRFEIEEVDAAMGGMAGSTAEMNREATLVRRELGEALTPVVVTLQRAFVDVLGTTKDLIGFFREYPGVLAGVTAAVGALVAILAVERAGGLGAVLLRIPGLATAAGRAIAVAFGPAGLAALAVAALAMAVAGIFSDIRKAEAELATAEANRQRMRATSEKYRVSDDLVSARQTVNDLQREVQEDIERLRTARKMNAPTAGLLAEVQAGTAKLDEARKALAAAQSAYDKVRVAANQPKPTGKGPASEVEELGASVTKLIPRARELVAALNAAKGAEAIARAQAALDAFTNKNKDAQAAVAAVNKELADAARNVRSTATGANDLARELGNIADAKFKGALENASDKRLKELLNVYSKVTPNAERYAAVLAEIERREEATSRTSRQTAEERERQAAAFKDYLDSRKFDSWVRGLENATDKQLENARAVAFQTGALDKLRAIDAEMDSRRETRIQKLKDEKDAREKNAIAAAVEAAAKAGATLQAIQARKDALRTAEGHIKYAGTGMNRPVETYGQITSGNDSQDTEMARLATVAREMDDVLGGLASGAVDASTALGDANNAVRAATAAYQAGVYDLSQLNLVIDNTVTSLENQANALEADGESALDLRVAIANLRGEQEQLNAVVGGFDVAELETGLRGVNERLSEAGDEVARAERAYKGGFFTLEQYELVLGNTIVSLTNQAEAMEAAGEDALDLRIRIKELTDVQAGLREVVGGFDVSELASGLVSVSEASSDAGDAVTAARNAFQAGVFDQGQYNLVLSNTITSLENQANALEAAGEDALALRVLIAQLTTEQEKLNEVVGGFDPSELAEASRDVGASLSDAANEVDRAQRALAAGIFSEDQFALVVENTITSLTNQADALEAAGDDALDLRIRIVELTRALETLRAVSGGFDVSDLLEPERAADTGDEVTRYRDAFKAGVATQAQLELVIENSITSLENEAAALEDAGEGALGLRTQIALLKQELEGLRAVTGGFDVTELLNPERGDDGAATRARQAYQAGVLTLEQYRLEVENSITSLENQANAMEEEGENALELRIRIAELKAELAGLNNPLNDLREGFALGTVTFDQYRAGIETAIAALVATGDTSLATLNKVAVLRAELAALSDPSARLAELGSTLTGIGGALNNAFGESADGATKLFNAMGLIASTVPNLVQAFNVLATATGSAFNTALGWIGLVLSAIQFVLNLIGVFRTKTKEEDAPKVDTNAGFAFGTPDTGKSPSIALNAPSASGFSYGAGTIQAANVMQQAAGVMLQAGQLQLQAALALAGKAGISTGPTNALAWGV
jgi:hypothetical protein